MLLEHMHKKFEINQTKIKGGCQSGRKVVTHNSKSDLPLALLLFPITHTPHVVLSSTRDYCDIGYFSHVIYVAASKVSAEPRRPPRRAEEASFGGLLSFRISLDPHSTVNEAEQIRT